MPDTPTLEDFSDDPEIPEDPAELDEFMLGLHELDIAGIEVEDASEEDAPHGSNTIEEMEAHELTPEEMEDDR